MENNNSKTLSEFLKENGAYDAFIENCVERYRNCPTFYNVLRLGNKLKGVEMFLWQDSKEGRSYWMELWSKLPENIEPDEELKQEIIEMVELKTSTNPNISPNMKRMNWTTPQKRYMIVVSGGKAPNIIHNDINSARIEASRLSMIEIGKKVSVVEIICEFQSKVIIEELV